MINRRTVLQRGLIATLYGLLATNHVTRIVHAAQQTADNDEPSADGWAGSDVWPSRNGSDIVIQPLNHASLAIDAAGKVIFIDPVGGAERYASLPAPELILLTHQHGDHFELETLEELISEQTLLVANQSVFEQLPEAMQQQTTVLANGEEATVAGIEIQAIAAYNTTPERQNFHPRGRDNGYLLHLDGSRVYVAGDTEGTPEMRALEDIDIAFIPMNLPYTMEVDQAVDAVAEFGPRVVYPYHYRGKDKLSDTETFAAQVASRNEAVDVILRDWYAT